MEQKEQTKQIVIQYECDTTGDHTCKLGDISHTAIKIFSDKMDAIHFIAECTSCKDNIKEIHPELFYWEDDSKETANSNRQLEEYLNINFNL